MSASESGSGAVPSPPRANTRFDTLHRLSTGAMIAAFTMAAGVALIDLLVRTLEGGDPFAHGDWLISMHGGLVRRGVLGSLFLGLSDLTGLSPVHLVSALQVVLVVTVHAVTLRLLLALRSHRVRWLLVSSGAAFPLFWLANRPIALRKELFAFTALALLCEAARTRSRRLALLAVGVFAVGLAGHEGLILFVPLVVLLALRVPDAGRGIRVGAGAILLAGVLAGLVPALAAPVTPNASATCAPLVARGVAPQLCDGAITWLALDASVIRERLAAEHLGVGRLGVQVSAVLLALLPFLLFARTTDRPGRWTLATLLWGLPFLLLYPVAIDWGRWIDWHATSVFFLLVAGVGSGRIRIARPPHLAVVATCLAAGLVLSPHYVAGLSPGGAVVQVLVRFGLLSP